MSQRLRASLVNQMPDLSFQGLNLLRVLVDKELARPLAAFIARDGGADALGYAPAAADQAVRAAIAAGGPVDVQALVRRALQHLTTPKGTR